VRREQVGLLTNYETPENPPSVLKPADKPETFVLPQNKNLVLELPAW